MLKILIIIIVAFAASCDHQSSRVFRRMVRVQYQGNLRHVLIISIAASAISSRNSVFESAQSANSVAASDLQSIDSSIVSSVFAELTSSRPVDTVTTINGHEFTLVSTTGTQMLTMTTSVQGEITNIGGTAYVFATQTSSAAESTHDRAPATLPLALGYFIVFVSLALGAWSVL